MKDPAASPLKLPPADWRRLRALLDEGMALAPGTRTRWLQRLGVADLHLHPLLLRLLQQDPAARAALDTLPRVETADFTPARSAATPAHIGPYRVLRELGSGGMASVWLAERTDVLRGRRVALKLPHQTWSASRRATLAERLQREREILATLEHPNIARLYDAGVADDGQPWLALEFVEGERLDSFCRAHQLDVPARLRLFLQAVRAVAHAHARLVVHRDLKPANMLVTATGELRLLDFGIAKLLQDGVAAETELTQHAGRALTLQYASPEQVRGEAIGTASDVYALGVVLFELLTGTTPYTLPAAARDSRPALERAVLEGEPRRPSAAVADATLARTLRGDLDCIVSTALKKDAAERYATVAALAADIERYLEHKPVLAQPDRWAYRLQKYLRRHRLAVAAVAGVALALATGATTALWQAREARAQRDKALAAEAQARDEAAVARAAERAAAAEADLSSFLLSDLTSERPGVDMARQLDRATTMVRAQYRDDPGLRARMLLNLALSYRWIGLHEQADALFGEAEPLLQSREQAGALAHLLCVRASTLARTDRVDQARAQLARAAALAEAAGPGGQAARAECLLEEAWVARFASDPGRAITLVERALQHIHAAGRGDSELASEALNAQARAQHEAGRYADAAASARQSIDTLQRIGRQHTPGMRNAWGLLARSLRDGGRPLDAEPAHGGHGSFDPETADLPLPLRYDLVLTQLALGRHSRALRLLDTMAVQAKANKDTNMQRFIALRQLQALASVGQARPAQVQLRSVEALFAALRAQRNPRARSMLFTVAAWALDVGQLVQAQSLLDEAAALSPRAAADDSLNWHDLHRLRARLALARGDAAGALTQADAALGLARRHAISPAGSLQVAENLLLRAQAHAALGRHDAARLDAHLAQAQAADAAGNRHPTARLAAAWPG